MNNDTMDQEQYTRGIQDTVEILKQAGSYDNAIDTILKMCKDEPEKGRLVLKTLIAHGATHIAESFAKTTQARNLSSTQKEKEDAGDTDTAT